MPNVDVYALSYRFPGCTQFKTIYSSHKLADSGPMLSASHTQTQEGAHKYQLPTTAFCLASISAATTGQTFTLSRTSDSLASSRRGALVSSTHTHSPIAQVVVVVIVERLHRGHSGAFRWHHLSRCCRCCCRRRFRRLRVDASG